MMIPCERINLPNGLTAEVHDRSRSIAADTFRVEMVIRVPVPLCPGDFADAAHYERTRAVFGDEIVYEHRMERSFVAGAQREEVFRSLLAAFRQVSLPYLSAPGFRSRFAASKHREILRDPYRFRDRQNDPTESA